MAYPPDFLDELRDRIALSAVVGATVKLARRGREQLGLCPFHAEKTPSFTVSDDKGFYHCFGCGAHGDAIGYVMHAEGLSFPEAVERLAAAAGLAVPRTTPAERERADARATIHAAVEAACVWFQEQLEGADGRAARAYLAERELDGETIARFRLGWSPERRTALKDALMSETLPEALLVEAGMLIRPEDGGSYDRFRGRVMFPICDRRGRTIAFGGRTLGDHPAKYINSPDTPLFNKGRVLYGLAQAREAAREAGRIVVVEGYMDAIALSQAGIREVVAPLGTALTEAQMVELWRLAPEPTLCFDGDAAGSRAAARAAARALPLLQPGRSLRFAVVPPGDDPDSLVRRRGAGAVEGLLAAAKPLDQVIWEIETAGRDGKGPREPAFRANSVVALRYAIRAGIGIGMIPDYMTDNEADLVPVLTDIAPPTLPILFVYPEELKSSKKVQVLRDFLVAQARQWKF